MQNSFKESRYVYSIRVKVSYIGKSSGEVTNTADIRILVTTMWFIDFQRNSYYCLITNDELSNVQLCINGKRNPCKKCFPKSCL